MPLMDLHKFTSPSWGTVSSIRVGDVAGPAAGMSTSSSTNDTALSVYGMNQFAHVDGMEYPSDKPWRKHGVGGQVHGYMTNSPGDGDGDGDGDGNGSGYYGNGFDYGAGYDGYDGGAMWGPTAGMEGTVGGSAVATWFGVIAILILLKMSAEQVGEAEEFRNVRVGFFNILVITFSSVIGFTFLKWFFGTVKVPGISPLIEAV